MIICKVFSESSYTCVNKILYKQSGHSASPAGSCIRSAYAHTPYVRQRCMTGGDSKNSAQDHNRCGCILLSGSGFSG